MESNCYRVEPCPNASINLYRTRKWFRQQWWQKIVFGSDCTNNSPSLFFIHTTVIFALCLWKMIRWRWSSLSNIMSQLWQMCLITKGFIVHTMRMYVSRITCKPKNDHVFTKRHSLQYVVHHYFLPTIKFNGGLNKMTSSCY